MTGSGNNTWLLDGALPTLIDAGIGAAAHLAAIDEALGGRALAQVLVTHGHADHASGVPAMQAMWPELQVFRFLLESEPGVRSISAGEHVVAGDDVLEVIHTPGHSLDHVCFWRESTRDLFAGDMLAMGTTVMIPGNRGGGMRAYLGSLHRMAELSPRRVFPGHGRTIDDPATLIAQYVTHREMRHAQVLELLGEGMDDPREIVARLYPDLPAGLANAAAATIEAHIEMAREDGL